MLLVALHKDFSAPLLHNPTCDKPLLFFTFRRKCMVSASASGAIVAPVIATGRVSPAYGRPADALMASGVDTGIKAGNLMPLLNAAAGPDGVLPFPHIHAGD